MLFKLLEIVMSRDLVKFHGFMIQTLSKPLEKIFKKVIAIVDTYLR